MTRLCAVPVLAAIWFAAGCGETFDPYNRLNSLRVLAIASEPVAPLPGETAVLTPLVYTPEEAASPGYAWSWCPLAGSIALGARCAIEEDEFAALAAQSGVTPPPYDLGSEPTAAFENVFGAELLAEICGSSLNGKSVLDCELGFPVQIKLIVTSGSASVETIRTLHLRFFEAAPNRNPTIEGFKAQVGDPAVPAPEVMTLDADASVDLRRNVKTPIIAQIAESAAETYVGLGEAGQAEDRRERLVLTWFVESGATDHQHTSFVDGSLPFADAVRNLWKPANTEDYPKPTALLLVVIRDDRDGVGWREATVSLSERR